MADDPIIGYKLKIEGCIESLVRLNKELKPAAQKMAETMGQYDEALAKEIVKLKYHSEHPATLIPKIAQGNCKQALIDMEVAKAEYKAILSKIESARASLNGYQSIYRHIETG